MAAVYGSEKPSGQVEPQYPNMENVEVISAESHSPRAEKDIEHGDNFEDEKFVGDPVGDAELTPMEAFNWNVEGDQSPCTSFTTRYVLILQFPK